MFHFHLVLETELGALCMPSRCFTAELHSQSQRCFVFFVFFLIEFFVLCANEKETAQVMGIKELYSIKLFPFNSQKISLVLVGIKMWYAIRKNNEFYIHFSLVLLFSICCFYTLGEYLFYTEVPLYHNFIAFCELGINLSDI